MITLKYTASSGNEYDLNMNGILTRVANFHAWKWSPVGVDLKYGQRVTDFSRDSVSYQATLVFNGTKYSRRAFIDQLHEDFEADIRNMTPGKITWGDWYIQCYIIESSTEPAEQWTENTISIFCPRPFWVKEEFKMFSADANTASTFLDYSFDFSYDYWSGPAGSETWVRSHPFPSDFQLTIFGEAAQPTIYINGHRYGLTEGLEEDEYVTIDSRNHTIIKTNADSTTENYFDYRDKTESIFELIPGGSLTLEWEGSFGFNLRIYDERSEPAWS